MPKDFTDLLMEGFYPEYTPPDNVLNAPLDMAAQAAQPAETEPSFLQPGERLAALQPALNALLKDLEPTRTFTQVVTDPFTGEPTELMLPQQYLELLPASPTLAEQQRMDVFEAYHTGENGNLNVWLLQPTDEVSQEVNLDQQDSLTKDQPTKTVLEYVDYKAALQEESVWALQYAFPEPYPELQSLTLADILGYDNPVIDSIQDIEQLKLAKTELQQLYQLLRLLYNASRIELLTSIGNTRQWTTQLINREVSRLELAAVSAVYNQLLKPVVTKALEWNERTGSPKILNRLPILGEMREAAVSSLYYELARAKWWMVDLAKTDLLRHKAIQNQAGCTQKSKKMQAWIRLLREAIMYLEAIISDPMGLANQTIRWGLSRVKMPKGL